MADPRFLLTVVGLGACLGACSTYPLPQDVTGDNTYDIVVKIRCEARDALREIIIGTAEREKDAIVYRNESGRAFAERLRERPDDFRGLEVKNFRNQMYDKVAYYQNSIVNYDFSLQGTENNLQGAGLGLRRIFPGGIDTVGLGILSDRTRDVKRAFVVSDRVIHLAKGLDAQYCAAPRPTEIIYPMGGKKKIIDLFQNYFDINLDSTLEGSRATPNLRSMSDTLIFKTRFTGNVTPNFTFLPAGSGLTISGLSLTNTNFREDNHVLALSITTSDVQPGGPGRRSKRPPSDEQLREDGETTVRRTREKNLQDAVILLGDGISRLSR